MEIKISNLKLETNNHVLHGFLCNYSERRRNMLKLKKEFHLNKKKVRCLFMYVGMTEIITPCVFLLVFSNQNIQKTRTMQCLFSTLLMLWLK